MKIRHPQLIRLAGFTIQYVVRGLAATLRYRAITHDPACDPHIPGQQQRFLYSFWHENIVLCGAQYRGTPSHVLISRHADGEMIAQACRYLGLRTVRGSTDKRGAVEAIRQILRLGNQRNIVITPDGPRGPRREVQPGLIYLASRTGLPIVPVGFGYRAAWRLRSWDRFAIPWPFSPAVGVLGEPLRVPAEASRQELEAWRHKVQRAMDAVQAEAEERGGRARW